MDLTTAGIDALDLDLLNRWSEDVKVLPELIETGGYGRIESSYTPLLVPAWPTLYTGKCGRKHGVFGFTKEQQNGHDRTLVSYDDVQAESVREITDDAGLSCGVMNLPLTYSPRVRNWGRVPSEPVPSDAGA